MPVIDSEIVTPAIPSHSRFECSASGTSMTCRVGGRTFDSIGKIDVHFAENTECTLSGSRGEKRAIDCKAW
jgi:hypothetical protein